MGGRDRIAHELGQAKNQEQATERWKGTQREEGGAEVEGQYLWSSRKQQGLCARVFPD
jgi:hypothetical protein